MLGTLFLGWAIGTMLGMAIFLLAICFTKALEHFFGIEMHWW